MADSRGLGEYEGSWGNVRAGDDWVQARTVKVTSAFSKAEHTNSL